ncbi:MAG: tetratricopeptide repeat protein [Elusimicrobia bacterium]|nr:tetratricopeptide repeat protein [Elusimicrobiota bacterium]
MKNIISNQKNIKIKNGYKWTFVICLLLIQQIFIIKSIQYKAAVTDEPVYLSSGYSIWKTGDYKMVPEHPPLSKLLFAVPLLFLPLDAQTNTDKWKSADQWGYGHDFLYNNKVDADKILFSGRLSSAFITFLLGILIFLWVSTIFGNPAGFLSLAIYSFEPNILAWGGLAMTEIVCMFFLTLTIYFYWLFAKFYKYKYLVLTGIFAGLTTATRFPGAIVFPILFVLTFWLWWHRKEKLSRMLLFFGVICIAGIVSLTATYRFTEFQYYFDCLKQQFSRVMAFLPGANFFCGKMETPLPWYYYFYAIVIKTPISVLILYITGLILAVLTLVKKKQKQDVYTNIVFILAPIVIWLIFASVSSAKLGLRYVLPIYPFLVMTAGHILDRKTSTKIIAVSILGIWTFYNTLSIYPHFFSYFNEFVGGSKNGYKYLVDSNLDLGQDIKGLKQKITPEDSLTLAYLGNADYRYYGLQPEIYGQLSLGCPIDNDFVNTLQPKREILAVSVSLLQMQWITKDKKLMDWLDEFVPYDNVGYSILLYDITNNVSIYEHLAYDYTIRSMWKHSERAWKRVHILDPEYKDVYYYIGVSTFKQKKWQEAIENLSKAVKYFPDNAMAYYYLGLSFVNTKQYNEAELSFKRAIEINYNNATVHNDLGILYGIRQMYEKALKEFEIAIKINPQYTAASENYKKLQKLMKK